MEPSMAGDYCALCLFFFFFPLATSANVRNIERVGGAAALAGAT